MTDMHLDELDTPALWVDLDTMEHNLSRMADYCRSHGLALRPHIKTHKVPELARRQLELGAIGITCAKVSEAEIMAGSGCGEILLAYPVWGGHKWPKLAALAERVELIVATDSLEQVQAMAEGLGHTAARDKISLLVEVNAGMGRCGLTIDNHLTENISRIADVGIPVRGMMFYPGQIRKAEDKSFKALCSCLAEAGESFIRAGVNLEVVSGGSTPTAFSSHLQEGLTEIRPGTYIFNDRNTVNTGAVGWEDCALRVRCRVVSTSVPGVAVIDGGNKCFTDAPSITGSGFGHLPGHPQVQFERMWEEHGLLRTGGNGDSLRVGDTVDVIPNHACTAVNMHHKLYGVRSGLVEHTWAVAAQGMIQ
jgi:D-serine deaminase-like pyridoxal phosphate-dependent protein